MLTILVVSLLFSCSKDIDPLIPTTPTSSVYKLSPIDKVTSLTAIGVRHDRKRSDYVAMATNVSPYNGDEFPDFSPIMCITIEGDLGNGTGTLISPTWLITAAHNFYLPDTKDKPFPAMSQVRILVGNDASNPVKVLKVAEVIMHPHWAKSDGGYEQGTDMALVRLAEPVTNITPAQVNYDINAETLKDYTWSCGYGNYTFASTKSYTVLPQKYASVNVLDRIMGGLKSTVDNVNYTGGLLAYDFDSPDGKNNTLGDNIIDIQEKILGPGTSAMEALDMEGTTIAGDSGGPIFMKINGVWKVCGVLHGGVGNVVPNQIINSYGDISVYIRTASQADWIKSIVK